MAFDPVVISTNLKVFEPPGIYLVEDTSFTMKLRIWE